MGRGGKKKSESQGGFFTELQSFGILLQSRVFCFRHSGSIDKLREASFGRVLENKGLHELISVVAVNEAVQDGVDAAMD